MNFDHILYIFLTKDWYPFGVKFELLDKKLKIFDRKI